MTNRLTNETSPYLLQHIDNPVDWYPWGEEALARAREEDKPILLSIGYAACHWCHVMAHESFEDEVTAQYMNEHFINIKVDREERPDLDNIYMSAVVAMTGQGGWPMTVALTPTGHPFYGGTYFPPRPRYGMPSFRQVLQGIVNAWQTRREDIIENAEEISRHIAQNLELNRGGQLLDPALFDRALAVLAQRFDARKGGFGGAPKFPPSMTLEFLLRMAIEREDTQALHMADHTLKMMAQGGLYDQIGGGFARYSTDADWLVPHFEKMLYDNGQLARVYLHAWQVTGEPLYKKVVEETLDWVIKEMRDPAGGFYSSLDADSEGVEGKFYVWSQEEIQAILGDQADLFLLYYDVTARGNWEGHNILNVPRGAEEVARMVKLTTEELEAQLATARQKLYDVRAKRIWPGLDDKVLTAWNGLMLAAFAEAGRVLSRPDYSQIAVENAEFLYTHMRTESGRLLRTWKAGTQAKYNAYLEDYAYLADALIALYQTTFDERWFVWAKELADMMLTHFQDEESGGFYDTSDDHEKLIQRPKDLQDNAVPSGNAMAANILLKLSLYTGNSEYWDIAEQATSALYGAMAQYATGFGQWLQSATLIMAEAKEIAVVGDPAGNDTQTLLATLNNTYRPYQVIAVGQPDSAIPLLHHRTQHNNQATAYVCQQFVCKMPVTTPNELASLL